MTTQSDFSEADLNKELDGDIDSLIDNFGRIINNGFVRQRNNNMAEKTKLELAYEEQIISSSASNIITTVESMLTFTNKMKQALLNKDFRLLNTYASVQSEKIEAAKDVCAEALLEINEDIIEIANEIENVLGSTSSIA